MGMRVEAQQTAEGLVGAWYSGEIVEVRESAGALHVARASVPHMILLVTRTHVSHARLPPLLTRALCAREHTRTHSWAR